MGVMVEMNSSLNKRRLPMVNVVVLTNDIYLCNSNSVTEVTGKNLGMAFVLIR